MHHNEQIARLMTELERAHTTTQLLSLTLHEKEEKISKLTAALKAEEDAKTFARNQSAAARVGEQVRAQTQRFPVRQ